MRKIWINSSLLRHWNAIDYTELRACSQNAMSLLQALSTFAIYLIFIQLFSFVAKWKRAPAWCASNRFASAMGFNIGNKFFFLCLASSGVAAVAACSLGACSMFMVCRHVVSAVPIQRAFQAWPVCQLKWSEMCSIQFANVHAWKQKHTHTQPKKASAR